MNSFQTIPESWFTDVPPPKLNPSVIATTNTLHVAYRPGVTDRGNLYGFFRSLAGFALIGFYDTYVFVRFLDRQFATSALAKQPYGCVTYEPAKLAYKVPYPQPLDEQIPPCKILHVTHLPPNYNQTELSKIFGVFNDFVDIEPHGKYGYVYFASESAAINARTVLRSETNLVVSFAKNAARKAFSSDSGSGRSRVPSYSGFVPRIQTSPSPNVSADVLANLLASKCNISEVNQPSDAFLDQIVVSRSESVLNTLELGSAEFSPNVVNAANINCQPVDSGSPVTYSPPPLSPQSFYSEQQWSRRSSADSASSADVRQYSPQELPSQYFNNTFANVPAFEPKSPASTESLQQVLSYQRFQIMQLQYLQQQQLQQIQKHNEMLQMARMRRDLAVVEDAIWKNNAASYGYPHITADPLPSHWSPFESKLGYALPMAQM